MERLRNIQMTVSIDTTEYEVQLRKIQDAIREVQYEMAVLNNIELGLKFSEKE